MKRDLVVFSLEPWDDIWRRNQYLIDGLLRHDAKLRVLFVEPANDILYSALSRRRVGRGRGLRVSEEYGGRLFLYQPDKVLPRAVGPTADMLLRASVRRVMQNLAMREPVLWVNDPSWAGMVARTDSPSLYDMTDDWLAADRSRREHDRIAANEEILFDRCVTVIVCSEGLYETRSRRRDVVLIPNAVDVQRYRMSHPRPADLVERSALYLGTLHEDRLDMDLVLRTADALRSMGGELALVGPSALSVENASRLEEHPAIFLAGARAWTEVPAYLQHAGVLVVPHVIDGFTDSLDPIKLYEYRAVGRPIVSTAVAGFRQAPAGVTISSAEAFPIAVLEALTSGTESVYTPDIPDWSDRVQMTAGVVDALFDQRRGQ